MFAAIAGSDEDTALHAGVPAAFDVRNLVADHVAGGEVDAELVAGVEQHLRRRLAAAAGLIRCLGREVDFAEGHAELGELPGNTLVDRVHLSLGVVATTDAGLVGDNEQLEAPLGKPPNGFASAGDKFDFFRFGEVAGLDDERSVSVKKDGGFAVRHAV